MANPFPDIHRYYHDAIDLTITVKGAAGMSGDWNDPRQGKPNGIMNMHRGQAFTIQQKYDHSLPPNTIPVKGTPPNLRDKQTSALTILRPKG